MSSFYTEEELANLGLKSYGENVKLSRFAQLYSPSTIIIGNNVRIDDFCILSGQITIGSNVHVSAYVALYGGQGIELEDYSGISPRTSIFSAMDDFSGDFLIGPIHDEKLTNVTGGKVLIKKYVQLGAHCVIFPNLTIGEGAVVGALSMVREDLQPWQIYCGIPVRILKERNKALLEFFK